MALTLPALKSSTHLALGVLAAIFSFGTISLPPPPIR
jgi:hypothetical protein